MRSRRTVAWLLVFLAVTLMGPPSQGAPVQAGLSWTVTTVDTGPYVGRYSSLVLAPNGSQFVSYLDQAGGFVKVATWSGSSYSIEVVDGPSYFEGDTSLAMDPSGDLHLSYYEAGSQHVRYAWRSAGGGPWNVSDVDRGLRDGFNELAVDRFGAVHLAYSLDTGALRYARRTGGSWTIEPVDPGVILARYESIAVDRDGHPHIAYYGIGNLRYAVKSGTAWSVEVVDSRDYVGWFSRVRLDSGGRPHIAYYDSTNRSLDYAVRGATGWSTSVADASGDCGWDPSIAIGPDDLPRIAYYARIRGDLRYAVLENGSWFVQTADDVGVVGWEPSLALDAALAPHITSYDWSRSALRHAVGAPTLGARTIGAATVGETVARLRGEVTSLGPYAAANASFEWRALGETVWRETPPSSLSAPGTFEGSLSGLNPNTTYEYRAKVEAGGLTSFGATVALRTRPIPRIDVIPIVLVAAGVAIAVTGFAAVLYLWFRRRTP